MTDHPDIEKLPLKIDGVPVREVVREVFRNPENGTPDNISKAGCLALVMKRKEVWNAWRTQFPVVIDASVGFKNIVNLSSVDFRLDEYKEIEFSDKQFGDRASFEGAQFGAMASFECAQFGNVAEFDGAQFWVMANFDGAQFGDWANFDGAQFEGMASFNGTQFGVKARFYGAQFEYTASFNGTQFGNWAYFNGAQFGHDVSFSHARFGHYASFRAGTWEELTTLYSNRLSRAKEWASNRGLAPDIFLSISFAGCTFEGQVDFSNRQFLDKTSFGCLPEDFECHQWREGIYQVISLKDIPEDERRVRFGEAPVFHGCKLHQDTSFEDAKFPDATGSEEAARAYRTLKLAFSKQQATREEQRFFKLEMEEEAMRATWLQRKFPWVGARPLYFVYKYLSDFGLSVWRPLFLLVVLWLVFAQIYGAYSAVPVCMGWNACDVQTAWLQYSAAQALPLPGFDKLEALKSIEPSIGWLALHKALSLAALFLAGLALRNLFKLK